MFEQRQKSLAAAGWCNMLYTVVDSYVILRGSGWVQTSRLATAVHWWITHVSSGGEVRWHCYSLIDCSNLVSLWLIWSGVNVIWLSSVVWMHSYGRLFKSCCDDSWVKLRDLTRHREACGPGRWEAGKKILLILAHTLVLHIKIPPSTALTTAAHLSNISVEFQLLRHNYHYLL